MSASTEETSASRSVVVPSIETSLHARLGLSPDQTILDYDALNRTDYAGATRTIIGGAMVVQCVIAGSGIEGTMEREIEVDDTHRPLPEVVIAELGLLAINNDLGNNPQGKRRHLERSVFTR